MHQPITLEEYVRLHMIVIEDFFKNTVIPSSGMSGQEVDEKLDHFAEQAHKKGRISDEEKNLFLDRHTVLGIGKSNAIPPKMDIPINCDPD